ncbi:phosphoribosylamine--glycine ligase [Inediibacterium massiliense]|uniref:phosphoribosylamine--glycine ligase n=1 Tax=Inediibacterium massiliense TaxID=1658111 RepID=UPI0006B54C79|nr:phosphoribosylamine--glycine ligase [Inediibacterium massiliense]
MNVLVIGSGGREHAIIYKISQSPKVKKIYCAPGNAGIKDLAQIVDIKDYDIEGLLKFAKENKIDLTIVGPEVPLVLGIVDKFQSHGLKIFGPNKKCARLEGSKAYTKDFLMRHSIPTAQYEEYTDFEKAKENIDKFGYPVVLKADGLAAGKGVVIAQNKEEAMTALEEMMKEKKFGQAGAKIVIEEYLTGIEASILCFVDGKTIVPMVSAQDYKKVYDKDQGPNTGGMGSYSPSFLDNEGFQEEVQKMILSSIIEGFQKDQLDFKGILFIGLMITNKGIKVLEFNVRFGDPETQVILPRLKTDLIDIMESIIDEKLDQQSILWREEKTVCVVVASGGYPEDYEKGKVIYGLDDIKDSIVFHAGTKEKDGEVFTNGGRVLGVMACGKTVEEAREKAYKDVSKISFEEMHYRKDIGKVITPA